MTDTNTAVLEVRNLSKSFQSGTDEVVALNDVSFSLQRGEVLVVTGPSGSGKSSLLHALSGLEPCDSGSVLVDGTDVATLKPTLAAAFRRRELGFVFQFFNLIATLTAVENVAMPLILDGVKAKEADERAAEMLNAVGLSDQQDRYGAQLSGGQMQRVAVARALVGTPSLVLADEPTGSLDRATGVEINALLHETATRYGAALVIVTHDVALALPGDHVFAMRDGQIEERGVA